VLEGTARDQVPLDVFWLRVVRQRPHRLDKPADRPQLGRSEREIAVLERHLRIFARAEPHVFPGTAQPH
jgi:hypothetical protein